MKRYLLVFPVILVFVFTPFSKTEAASSAVKVAPIKILIVPGHDNEVWGSQYGTRKEADMNLNLATQIYKLLKKDKKFEAHITRDANGYVKEFADYFKNHEAEIISFKEAAKAKTKIEVTDGTIVKKAGVPHVPVSKSTSIVLYGINKWANENKIDAVLHVHFNDYPRATNTTIGKYTGFTIYMPDGQMVNSQESRQLGLDIFTQLHKKYSTSTYPLEAGGIIKDQKLIAVGASNTLEASVRSVLVEYGYIYEKKFRKKVTRDQAYKNMASLTVAGIKNYFSQKI